jgi:hypothetical protein
MFVIAMGKCLEVYSKYYPNVFKDGKRVEVEEAVNEMDDLIDSLLKIKDMLGPVDELTRIYCSYIAGFDKISYDALHKRLSKGGVEVGLFEKEQLVQKAGNTIKVVKPQERRVYIEEKSMRGRDLLTIDKVHMLYSIYAEGKPIVKYLPQYGGEDVRKVSELLYKKTGDEIYAKIAGIATTSSKKVKVTLDKFAG